MHNYRAVAPLTVPVGALLELSPTQAAARAYGLTRDGTGWRVRLPVQFKTGEEFGYEGELPKALADLTVADGARRAKSARQAQPDLSPPPPSP